MSVHQIEVLILACLVAVTCAIPGVFLILRRVALMSDAISHAILLGIVVAFMLTKNLSSPLLIIGATVIGLLTVVLTEMVINTQKLKKDAAIGLIFPLLFSIGVILLNYYASDIHLDADCVIFGEIAFAPFNRLIVNGLDFGVQGIWVSGAVLVVNIIFFSLFYKELKITTFDAALAASLGFAPIALNYALMAMVSVTAVASFESVGSILVVALMIAPPASAYLLTSRLSSMIFLSVGFGIMSAIGGYFTAYFLDANIAGSMATFSGLLFLMTLIFAPEEGILAKTLLKKWKKWDFAAETLAVHLLQAEYAHAEDTERVVDHMNDHMLWNKDYTSEAIAQSIKEGLVRKEGDKLSLTPLGREKAKNSISKG